MKTAVITDSASYLDKELADKYRITVLPITVIFGQTQYRDGIDITSEAFLEKLATTKQLPTTAQALWAKCKPPLTSSVSKDLMKSFA